MRFFHTRNTRITAALLAFLVVTGGIAPFVASTHVSDLWSKVPRPWDDVPDPGVGLLDSAVQAARDALDGSADQADGLLEPLRAGPQVPATFFHDIFNPDDRVGGFGEWQASEQLTNNHPSPGANWHLDASGAGHMVQPGWGTTPSAMLDGADIKVDDNTTVPVDGFNVDGIPLIPPYERHGITQGYRFGDTQGYPLVDALDPNDSATTFTLASPVISLRSLPVTPEVVEDLREASPAGFPTNQQLQLDDEGTVDLTGLRDSAQSQSMAGAAAADAIWNVFFGGTPAQGSVGAAWNTVGSLAGGAADPERIILYMDHKYHLAHYQNSTPTDEQLDWARVLVLPEGAPPSAAVPITPLRGSYTQSIIGNNPPVLGYTEAQFNFTEEAFDLSRWAGQDVQLLFQVSTDICGSVCRTHGSYFDDSRWFNTTFAGGDPFYGWALSNVRVEGPAHLHNVRLDRVLYPLAPSYADHGPNREGDFVAAPGTEAFEVLVLNRGQVTEDVTVTLQADWDEPDPDDEDATVPRSTACAVLLPGMRPGEAKEATIDPEEDCTGDLMDIMQDVEYRVTLGADLAQVDPEAPDAARHVDQNPIDNERSLLVTAQGADIRFADRLQATPFIGSDGQTYGLSVPLFNRGAHTEAVDLDLSIHWRPLDEDQDCIDPDTGRCPDVQDDPGLVQFIEGPLQPDDSVQVPRRTTVDLGWHFVLFGVGLYEVELTATAPDGTARTVTTVIGVLKAPGFAYQDEFTGSPEDDGQTWVDGTDWSVRSLLDIPLPPGCMLETCTAFQMPRNETSDDGADSTGLRGDMEVDAADAGVTIGNVSVTFLHYVQDLRCATRPAPMVGVNNLDTPMACDVSGASRFDAPSNRLQVRFVQGTPTSTAEGVGSFGSLSAPTDLYPWTVQHVGGSHYRNAYYTGQWIEETHVVPVRDLLQSHRVSQSGATGGNLLDLTVTGEGQQLPSFLDIPAGRLAGVALEFLMEGRCPTPVKDTSCPLWNIARVEAQGIPVAQGAEPVQLLHWSGLEETETRGTWYSYFREAGAAQLLSREVCADDLEDVEDPEDLDAHERRFLCSAVQEVVLATGPAAETTWRLDPGLEAWTNAEEVNGVYQYDEQEGGRVELLESPVFIVPGGQPTLTFKHRFNLQPYSDVSGPSTKEKEVFRDSPSFHDSGMVMMRFLDPDDPEVPVTPYLPVFLGPGRFQGSHCEYYSIFSCGNDFATQESGEEVLQLTSIDLLDYHTAFTYPNIQGHRGTDSNGVDHQTARGARTSVDLRECDETGRPAAGGEACRIQLAFRLEVPDPQPRETKWGFLQTHKDTAREQLREFPPQHGGAEGWFIDSLRIDKEETTAFDLELVKVDIDADYDWESLGLGPGTRATAHLTVRNNGAFPIDEGEFYVTVRNADPGQDRTPVKYQVQSPPDMELAHNEETSVSVPFVLPSTEGFYHIAFGVNITGFLGDTDISRTDEEGDNDCRYLLTSRGTGLDLTRDFVRHAGSATTKAPCGWPTGNGAVDHVRLTSQPDIRLVVDVEPQAGRTGAEFPRDIFLNINNIGNVAVDGAQLLVDVQRVGATESETHRWTLQKSPDPGQQADWTDKGAVVLTDPTDTTKAKSPLAQIRLLREGEYFVTAELSVDGQRLALDRVLLNAFHTVYADSFEPGGLEPDPNAVKGTMSADDDWASAPGGVWRFGDAATGEYPDDADAALQLPEMDISKARRASFSLSHNYSFERGYDGGRVEVSVDGGDWVPVTPRRGYPGTVSAAGPLNPLNDSTVQEPAFTGRSSDISPATKGWLTEEFDLSQLDGFSTPVVVEQLDIGDFEGDHTGATLGMKAWAQDPRVTFDSSWVRPASDCPDDCWYRHNLHHLDPPRRDGSDPYWWSGTIGGATPDANPGTQLQMTFETTPTKDELGDFTHVRVAYWMWKDHSGNVCHEVTGVGNTEACPGATPTGDWARQEIPLGSVDDIDRLGADLTVQFRFQETACQGQGCGTVIDRSNRGAAIDGVRIEAFRIDDFGQEAASDVIRDNPGDPSVGYLKNGEDLEGEASFCSNGNFRGSLCQEVADGVYATDFGWKQVSNAVKTPNAWGVDPEQFTRQGDLGQVWRFGLDPAQLDVDPGEGNDGKFTYPTNARERLVTPRIDLAGLAGDEATLTFWERFDMMHNDIRSVWVQTIEPAPGGGELVGEWESLWDHSSTQRVHNGNTGPIGCRADEVAGIAAGDEVRNTNGWCQARITLGQEYLGKEVRIAFEVDSTRIQRNIPGSSELGFAWFLDEVSLEAETLVGDTVRIRLRAAADGSIGEGHWTVGNVQLVTKNYEDNVAILPDDPLVDTLVALGGTLDLTGAVRNLGPMPVPTGSTLLHLAVEPLTGQNAVPTVTFLDSDGDPLPDAADGRLPLHTLLPAGSRTGAGQPTDRADYHVRVEFPTGDDGGFGTYRLSLRLLEENGEADRMLNDDNMGDHLRIFLVDLEDVIAFETTFATTTPTVGEGVAPGLHFALENTGTVPLDATVSATATRLDGASSATTEFASGLRVEDVVRGETRQVQLPDWVPDGPGLYRVVVKVLQDDITESHRPVTHVLVGSTPLWYLEDFTDDPFTQGWSRDPAGDCGPADNNCWRLSSVFRTNGPNSLFLGDDMGGSYAAGVDARAVTPLIRLGMLATDPDLDKDIAEGRSPFSPSLSMQYRPMIVGGDDDCVTVEATPGTDTGNLQPVLTVPAQQQCFNGAEDSWQFATVPLFHEDNNVLTQGGALLTGDDATFAFRFQSDNSPAGAGFAIDRLTVSSYGMDVQPPEQAHTLEAGADKLFYLRVENTGAAADTYDVRVVHDPGSPLFDKSLATVEVLLDGPLTLEHGQVAMVPVRVAIEPRQMLSVFNNIRLEVQVQSLGDPSRVATGLIAFEQFGRDLPDLVTTLQRPGQRTTPIQQGVQETFAVRVHNTGSRASVQTDLVLFACPSVAGDPESLCDDGDPIPLGTVQVPVLRPDEAFNPTFAWNTGDARPVHHLVAAVADPQQRMAQFNPNTRVATMGVEIDPLLLPDLHVDGLRVVDHDGQPATRATAGDPLFIEGEVVNIGNADATNIRVRIVNQFELRSERVAVLRPGESVSLAAQWTAEPGNWVVLFDAATPGREAGVGTNEARWSIAVLSGTLRASWQPEVLHLDPGQQGDALLRLDNRRDGPVDVQIAAATDDFVVDGVPDRLLLARGAARDIPVVVTASPFVEPGSHRIPVLLTQASTGNTLATATLDVEVGSQREVRLLHDPVTTTPGTVRIPLTLENQGTSPESLALQFTPPDGWTATALQPTLNLAAGASRTVEVVLAIPADTPPGRHALRVQADTVLDASVPVDVTGRPVWQSVVEGTHSAQGLTEVVVRVENLGNAPGTPPFQLQGGPDAYLDIDPVPTAHEPGEARAYRVVVRDGEAGTTVRLPGQEEVQEAGGAGDPGDADALRVVLDSAGALRAGQSVAVRFDVRGNGQSQHDVPVRLWVDGVLEVEQRIDLEPEESRTVEFQWRPDASGSRLLTATVGNGAEAKARTVPVDVVESEASLPIPAPGLLLVLGGLAAGRVLMGRRRSQ